MNIEDIESNQLVEMTDVFHRIFLAVGCNPGCHCCYRKIPVGDLFKLSTIRKVIVNMANSANTDNSAFAKDRLAVIKKEIKAENTDRIVDKTGEVMLCEVCTPELYEQKQLSAAEADVKARIAYVKSGGGCFRVNGKLVH